MQSEPLKQLSELGELPVHRKIILLSRSHKRMLMILSDLLIIPLALWTAFALQANQVWPKALLQDFGWLFFLTTLLGIYIFGRLGLYRAIVRFMGLQAIIAVVKGVGLLTLCLLVLALLPANTGLPVSVAFTFAMAALIYVGGTRLLVRSYYHWLLKRHVDKEPVIIYGAGGAGVQLAIALSNGGEYQPVSFLDDDPALWGSSVIGIKVYPPREIASLVSHFGVTRILMALPSASRAQRKQALDQLNGLSVHVLTIPSMPEIVSGGARVDQLREVDVDDLLGRDPVPASDSLLDRSLKNKVVMVTGAGGSIGSELCRQIIMRQPTAIIMYELNEYALYKIDQELRAIQLKLSVDIELIPCMGSVLNTTRLEGVLQRYQVDTLYHAAAYKHVPMVEQNIIEGIQNNVFGTRSVAEAAAAAGVERFILISTDKAVRPTNLMGATKRMAELILQDLTTHKQIKTVFSIVRFGNVLGSSGSVVPLFRQQIANGGPITVTHPEITRYFMTITEAAQLVIQAGSMAQGGDVFVLDMGEPVKIIDLARKMVYLAGLQVSDDQHDGGIEIAYTGLRPGEKLFEELLISGEIVGTEHPRIMRASEDALSHSALYEHLQALQQAVDKQLPEEARALLIQAVPGYTPNTPVVDWLKPTVSEPALSGDRLH
ncbi:polysaccharide biosynthesis protein [Nitrincola alkalilacustris]|uniref:polysaccharide biosynthesis protein n=1 Tax=Nitrincola alkalilacustris TaxID=1571224 RepID=UPI00197F2C39|nr:nucleoside-diphosphate sugar epimerase/dehydratase [Nitrincola alkalilacustris]